VREPKLFEAGLEGGGLAAEKRDLRQRSQDLRALGGGGTDWRRPLLAGPPWHLPVQPLEPLWPLQRLDISQLSVPVADHPSLSGGNVPRG